MRKILFAATIVALLIFTGIVMYQGTSGRANIWGFTDISEENKNIDTKNDKLSSLITITYPQSLKTLNTSAETLQETKKQYENQAILLANSKYYKQTENYKHEFVLVKLGNYADDNNVDLRLDVTNSSVTGLYDINFTLTGQYIDIASYIYDIENDSKLGFKIEDFVMKPAPAVTRYNGSPNSSATTYSSNEPVASSTGTKNEVSANFTCKEISIDLKWLDENESVIPGIVTRGNPYIDSMTTLTGEYSNETLDKQNTNTNTNTNNPPDGNVPPDGNIPPEG